MGFINRFMNASLASGRAFLSTWRQGENVPPSKRESWNSYAARVARVNLFRDQYANRQYDDVRRLLSSSGRFNHYKFIRGLENPVTHIVDLYPSLCAGGAIDFDKLKTGALQTIGADETLVQAIIQVLLWSNWGIEKSTFIRDGALTGDAVIKIVDYPQQRKVAGEVMASEFIKEADRDAQGNVKSYVIEYELEEEISSNVFKTYTYREECDKDSFRTFKDNQPFAYFEDERGNPISEWKNPYGFVPLVIVPHKRLTGLKWGVNAYYHIIPQIDAMNDLASRLDDYLGREMAPAWLFNFGKPKNSSGQEIAFNPSSRDDERVLYIDNPDAKGQSLTHQADADAALQKLARYDANVAKNCPETALPQLRDSGNLTAPGVQAAFRDGEGRIMEAQANYDNGTIRWIQMAITMAAVRGYDKFTAYSIDSYKRGNLTFYIKPRPIIEDKLSKLDELQAWQQTGVNEKVWSILGATDEEIAKFKADQQQQQQPPVNNLPTQTNGAPADQSATGGTTNAPAIRGNKLPTDQATKNSLTDEKLTALFDEFHSIKGKLK